MFERMRASVRRKAPATKREIAAADKALGFAIPETYRSFLMVTNGGQPVQNYFSAMVGVQEFLGVRDLIRYRAMMEGRIPPRMLPVATAEGGNFILLAASKDQCAVYFWDHEHEGGGFPLHELAPSFDDFVSRLTARPAVAGPQPRVVNVTVRDPAIFQELLKRDKEMRDAPTVEWPPEPR